ncbi:hypothetical protein YC2023_060426 [Brassica napus]
MYPLKKSLNPSHLGARNDLLSSNLKLAQVGPHNTSLREFQVPAWNRPSTTFGSPRLQVLTSKPASTFFGHCWSRISTPKHASTTVGFNIPNQGQCNNPHEQIEFWSRKFFKISLKIDRSEFK